MTLSPKPKKIYSKNGCRECKRRKIKCDEVKPQCNQCVRLKKMCSYPQPGEKVLRVSKKRENSEGEKRLGGRVELLSEVGERKQVSEEQVSEEQVSEEQVQQVQVPQAQVPQAQVQVPRKDPSPQVQVPQVQVPQAQVPQVQVPDQFPHFPQPTDLEPRPSPPDPSRSSAESGRSTDWDHWSSTASTSPKRMAPGILPLPVPSNYPWPKTQAQTQVQTQVHVPYQTQVPYQTHVPSQVQSPVQTRTQTHLSSPAPFNHDDLNLLASDLNNLVDSMMFESNLEHPHNESMDLGSESSSGPTLSPGPGPSILPGPEPLPRHFPLHSVPLHSATERGYLYQFYHHYAKIILPFQPYDAAARTSFNPARDILLAHATKEPFLLAAILAQGAKASNNEAAHCHYLSKCLKHLGPALNRTTNVTSNVEGVLLTVLLLTSSNASNSKQDWRPHLRGAKDLLLKYAARATDLRRSKVVVFCKSWFISFEFLAGLSSSRGGTLRTDEELDALFRLDDPYEVAVLRELGIVNHQGFNLLFGYHHEFVPVVRDLIKVCGRGAQWGGSWDSLRVLSSLYSFSRVRFYGPPVLRTSVPPTQGTGGADGEGTEGAEGTTPPGTLLDPQVDAHGSPWVINWMDMCQHAYVYAGVITVLTKAWNFPRDSPVVAGVAQQLVELIRVVREVPNPRFMECALLMIQWPMLVGGLNCGDETGRDDIKRYFELSGAGSARVSIRSIDRVWGRGEDSEEDIDAVTY